MGWKNNRDAKRDIKKFSAEGIEKVVALKSTANELACRLESEIKGGGIRRLWAIIKPKGMPATAENNILYFTLSELLRHSNHVKILAESLAKAIEDPDNYAQALIITLRQYRLNPSIGSLIQEFGLDNDCDPDDFDDEEGWDGGFTGDDDELNDDFEDDDTGEFDFLDEDEDE